MDDNFAESKNDGSVIDIRKGIKEIETGAGKLSIASASYRPFSPFEFAKKKATTRKMKRRGGRKNLVKLPRLLAESCRHDRLFFSLSFHAGGKLDPRIYIYIYERRRGAR